TKRLYKKPPFMVEKFYGCRADFSCSSNRYYLSSWAFMPFLIFVRSRPCASYRGYILPHAYLSSSIYNSTFNKQESDTHVRSSYAASRNDYACNASFYTTRYVYIGRCNTESKSKKRTTHSFSEWLDLCILWGVCTKLRVLLMGRNR